MVHILCIGDSHIPRRARDIPNQIYNKLEELTNRTLFDYTLFTGDIIKSPELIEFLNSKTSKNFFLVMGNMDYYYGNPDVPIYQELEILCVNEDILRIGLTHGAQIKPRGDHMQLENLAIERNYKLLVSGHTHKEEIFLTRNGILLVNPGSVTGAWSFVASGNPSFIELDIDANNNIINANLFQLNKNLNEVNEFKSKFILKRNRIQSIE